MADRRLALRPVLPDARVERRQRPAHHGSHRLYKNKPANVIKVINESLWRYVVTDHTSGWNYSTYVTGGENATNLVDVLIDAMHRREGEAMFGVPLMVMLDPGSANTSAIFKNLCKALRIHVQINKPKNPRAKGQVEKGQDITERDFESTLRLLPADKVDSLRRSMRWWHAGADTSTAPGSIRARGAPATPPGCTSRPSSW